MTRALTFAIPMSLAIWGVIGALAWYAPEVLLVLGGGTILAVADNVADRMRKGRGSMGIRHPHAKLSPRRRDRYSRRHPASAGYCRRPWRQPVRGLVGQGAQALGARS